MATKKKVTAAEAQKRLERVVLLARRWAKHAAQMEVLAAPSHHLLKAVQKLEAME